MKAAITIDVDSLRLYHDIHGLPPPEPGRDPIYTHALPRFWELVDGRPVTLFLIGADAPQHPEAFAPVATTGSEIASHSYDHDHRLIHRPRGEIADDLGRAEAALAPLAGGRRPVGFRAPGYNVTPDLLEVLLERGYRYDSSLLPAPYYYLARAGALAWYRIRGRRSRSLAGDPRAFCGPTAPYRTSPDRYWRPVRDGALREIPMAVEPTTRLPIIGTSWVLWPRRFRTALLDRTLRAGGLFVFEMHAIDLLDATDPGVDPRLRDHQPDLRQPARAKWAALAELVRGVGRRADWLPLRSVATEI
jgi:peptidoglycan/xylan/chitin deacetylase (PgdA/CDA1 family)